jgi:uncharacterized membrane protein
MEFEDVIGYALRIGVIISAVLIVVGVILIFLNHGSNGFTVSQLSSPDSIINSSSFPPIKVVSNLSNFQGLDFIWLGLMVLISTPVLRVLLGIIQFAREHNVLYAVITIIVFFNLMFAIFILPILLGK